MTSGWRKVRMDDPLTRVAMERAGASHKKDGEPLGWRWVGGRCDRVLSTPKGPRRCDGAPRVVSEMAGQLEAICSVCEAARFGTGAKSLNARVPLSLKLPGVG